MSTSIPASTLDKFTTFGDLLRFLRRRAGLTQIELSITVGYSDTQISRLEQNLRLPDIPTIEARFISALGIEDDPTAVSRLLELAATVRREDAPIQGLCPYKGLSYFDEEDADLFVGREALTARVTERILALADRHEPYQERFFAIVGASGSGKSSLVRAGVVPSLRWNKISANWPILLFTPTTHPLESLATGLTKDASTTLSTLNLMDEMARDRRSLYLYLKRELRKVNAAYILLVVDQFEELFTQCRSEDDRFAFIDNLLTAASSDGGPAVVVITLRADLYAHCAEHLQLRRALARCQEFIGAMSDEELRRAIEEPARRGRWEFEPGLVDLILHDVGRSPAALPLLSHALMETWHRRHGRVMTLSGYIASGGVRGAIAETAEAVFTDQFTKEQQTIARRIFLRLTELGDEPAVGDSSRSAKLSELVTRAEEVGATQTVINTLADARLITIHEDTVQVSHEALIREWPTLRAWLEEDRQGIKLLRELTEAAQGWEAMEYDESVLYRGAKLAQALEWAQEHPGELNLLEHKFLTASQELAECRQRETEAIRQRELQAARQLAETEQQRLLEEARANRRLRWLVTGLAGALLVAFLSTVFALYQRNIAQNEAHLATSRKLAVAAENNLDVDPETSILLALEAIAEAQAARLPVPKEAQEALHLSVQASRLEKVLPAHPGGVMSIEYSPDGTLLASVGADRTLKLWDTSNGEMLKSVLADIREIYAVAFSPDGKYIATTHGEQTARIWDSQTLIESNALHSSNLYGLSLAFSPNHQHLVTGSSYLPGLEDPVHVWNHSTGELAATLTGHLSDVSAIAFSPNRKWLATSDLFGTVILWDAATFDEIHRFFIPGAGREDAKISLAFSPDGYQLAAASRKTNTVSIWNISNGNILTIAAHNAGITDIDFSPDGKWLATASLDRKTKMWEVSTGQELFQLAGHPGEILSLSFSPDGEKLATAGKDGTIRTWNILPSKEWLSFPAKGHSGRISFGADSKTLAAGIGTSGDIRLWALDSGSEVIQFIQPVHNQGVTAVAISPDGEQLASVGKDGTLNIWGTTSGHLEHIISGLGLLSDVSYSPDGTVIATGSSDSYLVRLWNAQTAEKIIDLVVFYGTRSIAFSPDGANLVVASQSGNVSAYVLLTDEEKEKAQFEHLHLAVLLRDHTPIEPTPISGQASTVLDLAFGPDGRRLAMAFDNGSIDLWQLGDEEPFQTLVGHTAAVTGVAFSPDGGRIATSSADGTARIWDVGTGKEQLLLTTEGGLSLLDIAISSDGKFLATSAEDAVRVYLIELDDLIQHAKSRLSRGFYPEECIQYISEKRCQVLIEPTPVAERELVIPTSDKVCLLIEGWGISIYYYDYLNYRGVVEGTNRYGWERRVFTDTGSESQDQIFERILNEDCELVIFPSASAFSQSFNTFKYPNLHFMILDFESETEFENTWTVRHATDQAAFLAGYLAASLTKTGNIGTFGGVPFGPVEDFMTGFEGGIRFYNEKYREDVRLLGWDSASRSGDFLGNFCCAEEGKQYTQNLLDQGVDIILPVAGDIVGFGAIQAVSERGNAFVIGVDKDYRELFPDYARFVLTNVEKRLDLSVIEAIEALAAGQFVGGTHYGTLENNQVGLSPLNPEIILSEQILDELEQIRADIIGGRIRTRP